MLFLVCLIATALGAISGIGGGVIIKPVLDAVSGLSVASISFLSGCTVLAMSVSSLLRSRGGGVKLDLRVNTLLAVSAAVGGVTGKSIFDLIRRLAGNDSLVGSVQSALMILLTVGVFVYMLFRPRIPTLRMTNAASCLAIGLCLGMLSSFLGIGGGPINLVVLYFFFSMDTATAALSSLYIILFSQCASLAGTLVQGNVPAFSPVDLTIMAAGGILGGLVGRSLSHRMGEKQINRVFFVLLVTITAISIYNFLRYWLAYVQIAG